jgi:PAS domain S-box-containing protein
MDLTKTYIDTYTDKLVKEFNKQHQIEQINLVLMEIAGGNFHQAAPVSDNFDEIDAIAAGVNMLSEELRDTMISRNYLDRILRSIVDMLFIFDENFCIQQITPKACLLLNQHEENFIGQSIHALFDGRQKKFVQRMTESLQQKGQLHNIETTFRTLDKKKLPVTLSLFALNNNRNVTTGYLMIAEDVKEKKDTSNTLKKRNEELQTLIYRTSHDLKGPLASMLGLFNIMEMEKQNLSSLQNYMAHLQRCVEKLNNTVLGLLEVGLVDQSALSMRPFYLYDMLQDVIESLRNFPGRDQVEVNLSVDKKLQIISSEKALSSVLQNLIENSIKYRQTDSSKTSVVHVNAHIDKGNLILLIKDNGQGMDKNVLKKAFNMFYRGNENSKGSGLGLFIVKSTIEKLKGEVILRSKVQEGTEIKMILPQGFL